jgi:hypothetical protein
MAETKVSGKAELAPANITNGDWLYVVDTSAGAAGGKKLDVDAFVWTQKDSTIIDNISLQFGTGNDADITFSGNDFIIKTKDGDFILRHNAAIGGGNILIDNNSHGFNTVFTNEDAGGTDHTLLTLDPDTQTGTLGKSLSFTAQSATMAANAITQTGTYIIIDTSGGAAEDLNTITATGPAGTIIICRSLNAARVPTFKDGVGNLRLSADFSLTDPDDTITLLYDGTDWLRISGSNNS